MQPERLSRALMVDLFHGAARRLYKKQGKVLVRPATTNETIFTIVAGKLETLNTASFGDVVVMNAQIGGSVERYILKAAKFDSRYDRSDETIFADGHVWVWAAANGQCRAVRWRGPPKLFEAPWGEEMLIEAGDYLCQAVPGERDDVYRIERAAFETTYVLVEETAEA